MNLTPDERIRRRALSPFQKELGVSGTAFEHGS
jgi:hypothetical protein